MSFILDALRKSETERQHKGSAEFANVPTSGDRREGPPTWLWVLGALLLVNLVVLIGLFLRPDVGPPKPVAATSPPVQPVVEPRAEEEPRGDFASRVAAARENAPAVEELPAPVEPAPAKEEPATTIAPPIARPVPARPANALPTIHEVRAQGRVSLPDLHVDIHVFSEVASDRFVFINMTKHKEGSQLPEGPLVEEITPDGVVLSMNGTTFLLPRD
jgi:general secretion pathway protein B